MKFTTTEFAAIALILSSVAVLPTCGERKQLLCAVNESNFLFDGWQQVQDYELNHFSELHAQGMGELRAIPNTVSCSWRGHEIPTQGALWYWRANVVAKSHD